MRYALAERQQLARVDFNMQSIVKAAEKSNTPIDRDRWVRMLADHDRLEARIQELEGPNAGRGPRISEFSIANASREELQDTFRKRKGDLDDHPYSKAFSAYLRGGMESLDGDQRELMRQNLVAGGVMNAQGTGSGSQGGFVVPTGFSGMLEKAEKWFGGVEGICGEFTTATGNPWPWPTVNDTANHGRVIGENVQNVETDIVFNQVTFKSYILSSDIVLVPLSLMEDSYFNFDALVAEMLGVRLGRLKNNLFTLGTGVTQPTGIVTAAVSAGLINTLLTGSTTSIAYSDLVNIESAVDPAYRYNSSSYWMFSDAVLKILKKLVDGNGRPLWQPGLSASFEQGAQVNIAASSPTILNHPYIINQDMATPAASAYTVLFGDMSKYKYRKIGEGVSVLRLVERYADYLQTAFLAWDRTDGNLLDAGTHPICVGQQSAT